LGATKSEAPSELESTRAVAERYHFNFVDLRETPPDAELLSSIPLELMVHYQFLPLGAQNGQIEIAVGDPTNLARLDELEMKLDKRLVVRVATPSQVHEFLKKTEPSQRVLDEEDAINELQLEIDDRVVQLLALHQLMAADLRFVLAVSRINNDLERIGDQAVNIAQGALRILRHPRVKPYVDLPRMTELVEEQVRNALNAVVRRDVELAQKVMSSDDQVDHYRDQIFRELLTYMMGDSSLVFPAFELILVAKNLERIGDHATNIAEDVIYIVQGQDIRHPSVDRR
jgi:phosphate transport system protein